SPGLRPGGLLSTPPGAGLCRLLTGRAPRLGSWLLAPARCLPWYLLTGCLLSPAGGGVLRGRAPPLLRRTGRRTPRILVPGTGLPGSLLPDGRRPPGLRSVPTRTGVGLPRRLPGGRLPPAGAAALPPLLLAGGRRPRRSGLPTAPGGRVRCPRIRRFRRPLPRRVLRFVRPGHRRLHSPFPLCAHTVASTRRAGIHA